MRRALLLLAAGAVVVACGARTSPGDLLDEPTGGGDRGAGGSSSGGAVPRDAGAHPDANGSPEASPEASPDTGTTSPQSCPGIPAAGTGTPGAPEVLAQLAEPAAIAVDANNLYVASYHPGPVSVVPLDASPAQTLDAIGSYNVAMNESAVFTVSISGVVASCAKTGCNGAYTTLATDSSGPWGVAADEANVYFTSLAGVWSVPVGGGPTTALFQQSDRYGDVDAATWIVLRDGYVYFVVPDDFASGNYSAEISRVPVGGGKAQIVTAWVATQLTDVATMAADCTTVYYGRTDGTLYSVPLDGGTPVQLATGQMTSLQIAVDEANLYFTSTTAAQHPGEQPSGSLRTMPIGGGPVQTLATFQGTAGGVAVDATYVYWANATDGSVSRMTK